MSAGCNRCYEASTSPLWVAQVVTRNRADRPCEKHSEETTMTTDNRTNEPTPEQVEAAAKALRADAGFMEEVHSALEVSWSEYIARLVLVAAQGAAPVVPSSGVDEDALVQRIYDELMTDDAIAEVWSNGKVLATARRLVKFAVQGGESRGE